MTLTSDAVMMLFYDITGDTADHDAWHSTEHFHERLSIPGFLRATRWIATEGTPRYMVSYEVSGTDMATAPAYLERLNSPSPWTQAMMPRFRGMTRGFCDVIASAGYGLGAHAAVMRFTPGMGHEDALTDWTTGTILPALTQNRGFASAHLLRPVPPRTMTEEQALRGPDAQMPWLLLVTAHDPNALDVLPSEKDFSAQGAEAAEAGRYTLHHTASEAEVRRPPKP